MERFVALREGATHVRFAGGIETKSDPKAVPSTKLLVLENGVFTRAISIRKRNGYEALAQAIDGSAAVLDDAIRMATRGDELLAFSSNRCYSQQEDADQWSDVGAVMSAIGSDRALVRTGTEQLQPDHATLSGITAAAWSDSRGGVWWSVVDSTTGRVHRTPTQADVSGVSPRCVAVGVNLHIYYAVPTQRRVMIIVVNPAAPAASVTPAILVDDLDSTNSMYDACQTLRTGTPAAIAWFEHATTSIRFGFVDASGVLGGPVTGHPSILTFSAGRLAASPLAVAFDFQNGSATDDRFVLAYVDSTNAGLVAFADAGDVSTPIDTPSANVAITAVSVQRVALSVGTGLAWTAWE